MNWESQFSCELSILSTLILSETFVTWGPAAIVIPQVEDEAVVDEAIRAF